MLKCVAQGPPSLPQDSNGGKPDCNKKSPDTLTIYASVMNPKDWSFVQGMTPENFIIAEGKNSYEIKCFSQIDEPLTVGILFDLSGSIQTSNSPKENEISNIVEGVEKFVKLGNPKNRYFMIGFSNTSRMILETTNETAKIDRALADISSLEAKGNTNIFNAVSLAIDQFESISSGKKVLLLISDGLENESDFKLRRITKDRLRDSGISVFLINLLRIEPKESRAAFDPLTWSQTGLEEMTANTGGHMWLPTNQKELIFVFGLLAEELRSQYTIGFAPKRSEKRRWQKLTVKLQLPKESRKNVIFAPNGYLSN